MTELITCENSWWHIVADNNFANIKLISRKQRFGKWKIEYGGFTIYCHDLASFYISAKDIFFQKIYDFKTSTPTPLIIDGGGHIGLFTLFATQKYPNSQTTIFEPDEESLYLLNKNVAINRIKNISIINRGLYKSNGKIAFSSRLADANTIFTNKKNTTISVVKLSDYISSEIDFLKLNIEGAELDVLIEIQPKLTFIKEIVIEYHGFPETGQNLHKILKILDQAGFRYLIHDFDKETNPATKPPFKIDKKSPFFLLIYAKRFLH